MITEIEVSRHLYTLVLLFYPRDFRREFQIEMARVFEDELRQAWSDAGFAGLLEVWLFALAELATVAFPMQLRGAAIVASALVTAYAAFLILSWGLVIDGRVHRPTRDRPIRPTTVLYWKP
jgi:hypothetical protein